MFVEVSAWIHALCVCGGGWGGGASGCCLGDPPITVSYSRYASSLYCVLVSPAGWSQLLCNSFLVTRQHFQVYVHHHCPVTVATAARQQALSTYLL